MHTNESVTLRPEPSALSTHYDASNPGWTWTLRKKPEALTVVFLLVILPQFFNVTNTNIYLCLVEPIEHVAKRKS